MKNLKIIFLVLISIPIFAQDLDLLPISFFKSNRESLMSAIGNDAIAIFYSNSLKTRSNDVEYRFKQDNNFYYLTGLEEPDAVLVLVPAGFSPSILKLAGKATGKYYDITLDTVKSDLKIREVLFLKERDSLREVWTGRTLGTKGATEKLGFQLALPIDEFKTLIRTIIFASRAKTIYFPYPTGCYEGNVKEVIETLESILNSQRSRLQFSDPTPILARMRMIKKPEEIELIKKAVNITVKAHRQIMMSCEPGMYEYEIQALAEYVFTKLGSEYPAFPSIIGSGENSVILHYSSNRKKIKDGDLIVVDIGAEYHNYCADVTRTIPANGKFTQEQREIYEIVLKAQEETIKMVRPGASFIDLQLKAREVIADGLLKLGVIKDKNEVGKYFMHGVTHHLGLDVHDVGIPGNLEPNMVITIEPGIYIPAGSDCDPKYWNIGVRIEDDVLVTDKGCVVLSSDAPKTIEEIERLMKRRGIGNEPID
ncbi:aminopeptidase P N-terminal domain-containing protein [Candidatus Chrysopegis kryptomonas]|jgi:Xaa-Pro aminopeptidase|uniref:Xaa-Pro aminopeptidase n=1 Tax=Candidatus Chryseopegocella kryptomonas TaxID=1633643 RepID=A0A0P1NT47_9BACT|nr:aminopeptidase P N-terminal domain-containing protein [Candidatus Chrysopegis kryptomonas]CUT02146.1 Xaa-Pro aminopeptidase [Candidatus Chrysopegis kryptomonas]